MIINVQEVITTLGGDALLLAAVAWLIKSVVSNRLMQDTEKFKNRLLKETEGFKIKLQTEADVLTERVKAHLIRSTNIHERQVDTLMKLYREFQTAQGCFQSIASDWRISGGVSDTDYRRLIGDALKSAHDTLLESRLLLPSGLAQQCDEFFREMDNAEVYYADKKELEDKNRPHVKPDELNKYRKLVKDSATKTIPSILDQIEKASRKIIHGEE